MVRAAKEMFTRSRKLTTYISDMKGISRQAARAIEFHWSEADPSVIGSWAGLRTRLLASSAIESARDRQHHATQAHRPAL